MSGLAQRIRWLFGTTEGLLLVVTGWDALIIAVLSIFSGPMASLGLPARLGLTLDEVSRIVMLYHALAVPFVAALVYLILDRLPFDERITRLVRPTMWTPASASSWWCWRRSWLLNWSRYWTHAGTGNESRNRC
jgi:hypothetical protein